MDFVKFYTEIWRVPVIPIMETKKPMVTWAEYNQGAMPTAEQLDAWFKLPCKAFRKPPWGISLVLQHNLFSLDLDTKEAFDWFKRKGAYPPGACIYKSARGWHVMLRSNTIVPLTVAEHNPVLVTIDKCLYEFGLGGDNNHLSHVPDTPGRYWEQLYEEPAEVDYEAWMMEYLGWMPDVKVIRDGSKAGWEAGISCPWHAWHEREAHGKSLYCNTQSGAFICFGCGDETGQSRTGTFRELRDYAITIPGYPLPDYVTKWLADYDARGGGVLSITPLEEEDDVMGGEEEFNQEEMPPALIEGIAWPGDVGLIFGTTGIGKSSLATSGTADLVVGLPFWGMEDWEVAEPLRVLYLDCENRRGETHDSVRRAIGKENKRYWPNFKVWHLEGKFFDIMEKRYMARLEHWITKFKPHVLWEDNLGKITGRDIIKEAEMKEVVKINRYLARKYNLLIILIHHEGHVNYNKDMEIIPGHPKGGSSLIDDANFVFYIAKPTGKSDRRRVIATKGVRSRKGAVRVGDEFILQYDHETTRLRPTTALYTMPMAKHVVKELGQDEALKRLKVNQSTLNRWSHGLRQPRGEDKRRLEALSKELGYVPRLTDITGG